MTDTNEDAALIAEIRARADAATPGPWTHLYSGQDCEGQCIDPVIHDIASNTARADLAFIAHAREDVPWLLNRLEVLTARVNELEGEVESVRSEAAHIASRYLAMIDARDLAISEFDTEHEELERSHGLLLNEQNARAKAEATLAKVRALSEAWKAEGVAPDFWIELNKALKDGNGGGTE